jgi:predicted dehydrogenase
VGFGLIGRRHADVIRRAPELDLAAVVEPGPEGGIAAKALGVPVFSTLNEMLDTVQLDGVVLATPTPLHVEQGLTCIAAG